MTDYEKQYQETRDACGDPFEEFMDFFQHYDVVGADVLDLGCGQGRDALFIARMGHSVLGVDVSKTGISQMIENARLESLDVRGIVADLVTYHPSGEYDVVILDRVLHMFKSDSQRLAVLNRASEATRAGGFTLIADTPKHIPLIRAFFDDTQEEWMSVKDGKGFLFFQKLHNTNSVGG
jgi:2-polyprenyl-3-methyl-5-hydroxy-6-metoxy-1,4-benzoquinol methylase